MNRVKPSSVLTEPLEFDKFSAHSIGSLQLDGWMDLGESTVSGKLGFSSFEWRWSRFRRCFLLHFMGGSKWRPFYTAKRRAYDIWCCWCLYVLRETCCWRSRQCVRKTYTNKPISVCKPPAVYRYLCANTCCWTKGCSVNNECFYVRN